MIQDRLRLTAMVFAAAVCAQAGGLWVQLGAPEANPEAKAMKAVVTFKPVGCQEPEKAAVSGVAIGSRGGRRQEIPLKITPLSVPGMYAITQQWPDDGNWVLQITARSNGRITGASIPAAGGKVDRYAAKLVPRAPSEEDLNGLLARK